MHQRLAYVVSEEEADGTSCEAGAFGSFMGLASLGLAEHVACTKGGGEAVVRWTRR